MSQAYTRTNDLDRIVQDLIDNKEYHESLRNGELRLDVLFYKEDGKGLRHRGSDVFAFVRINTKRERALGMADGTMIVDEERWEGLDERQRTALVDHELYHFFVKTDGDNQLKRDDLSRPILGIRPHDIEVGWFRQIAQEHGDASIEVIQAREMIRKHGNILLNTQMSFDFLGAIPEESNGTPVTSHGLTVLEGDGEETALQREERLDREEQQQQQAQAEASGKPAGTAKAAAAKTTAKKPAARKPAAKKRANG